MNITAILPHSLLACCLSILLLGTPLQVLAESSYLQELNSEADELATFENEAAPQIQAQEDNAALKQKKEFETTLKKELSNTYTIYRKLNTEQKSLVVEAYFASGKKLAVASRQIFNFYFKENH